MKYYATPVFIDALKEWDNIRGDFKSEELVTFVYMANYTLGHRDIDFNETKEERLIGFEKRIKYLIEKQKINELFIIKGLIYYITNFLKNRMITHGDGILFHEDFLRDNPGLKLGGKVLEKLKSPDCLLKMKNDYYRWKEIVANKLSEEQFEKWNIIILTENQELNTNDLKKMEEILGDKTFEEIYRLQKERNKLLPN